MRFVRLGLVVCMLGVVAGGGRIAEGRSLSNQLSSFISNSPRNFPGLSSALGLTSFPDPLGPVFTRLASLATDFPVVSTTPGYVYLYDPSVGAFVRSSASLGPVFLERSETIGAGHVSVGFYYLYGNVNRFDGNDLGQGLQESVRIASGGRQFDVGQTFSSIEIPTHKFNFLATYGVTDNWDVDLLLPLVLTHLNVSGKPLFKEVGGQSVAAQSNGFDEGSFGVGDLLLRTKYRFGNLMGVGVAGGMTLRFPTGKDEDFHGLGDWTLEPALILSGIVFGHQDVHANLGMEFNASDSAATRARYGIGVTLQTETLDWVALLIDVIGVSSLDNETITTTARPPTLNPGDQFLGYTLPAAFSPVQGKTLNPNGTLNYQFTIPRTDQVSIAPGLKFKIGDGGIAYLSAIVPLTQQGLQASVIAAVGAEYDF
jgi:hypothetical protein